MDVTYGVMPCCYTMSWAFGGFLHWKSGNNWEASGRVWIERKTWIGPQWQNPAFVPRRQASALREDLSISCLCFSLVFGAVGGLIETVRVRGR